MTSRETVAFGTGGSFGAFMPTHRPDQVEAALRGYLSPGDLGQLVDQVHKAAHRRGRKGKDNGLLLQLGARLAAASRPPVTPVAMRWYGSREGGEPVPVRLLEGGQANQVVTLVPPGVKWQFSDPEATPSQVFCQPVDDQGANLGERLWSLDSGDSVRVGSGVYLVPFDAIRTGDAADAH